MSQGKCVCKRSLNQKCATGLIKVFSLDKQMATETGKNYKGTFEFHVDILGSQADLEGEELGVNTKEVIHMIEKRCAGFKRKVAKDVYGADWDVYGSSEYHEFYE